MKTLSLTQLDKNLNGVILYEGNSRINGKPIVVIATGLERKSSNGKTGDMIQTYILSNDTNPIEALNNGMDESVCGDCKHRHFRSCYVNVAQAPHQVYLAYKKNRYNKVTGEAASEMFRGLNIRLGSYGEPASVDIAVWDTILKYAKMHSAYTHQWKKKGNQIYKKYCMASSDTVEEANRAMGMGWRPFLVRHGNEAIPKGFFSCPASEEAGKVRDCENCGVCKGGEYVEGKCLPTLIAHGPKWKKNFFNRGIKLMRNKKKFIGVFDKK